MVKRYLFLYPTDHVSNRTRDQEGCEVSLQTPSLCLQKRVQRSARDMSSTTQSTSAARNTNSVTVSAVHHQACGVPLEQIDDDVFRSSGFTHLGSVTPWYLTFVVNCAAKTSG